ncbi:MAG: TIGR01458 family HAD-type hydrolase [Methylotenera sp.]
MINFPSIKGILFDLDGVLYVGNTPVAGAIEAINKIRNSELICRFITNTSTLSLQSLQKKINALGFDIPQAEIISAPQAALNFLKTQTDPICRFLLADDVRKDFTAFKQSDTEAEYIVVGDIGNAWTYQMLNEVFACLMRGAKLIAIHKNRFWQTEQGLQMDIGAFIHGLEYASNSQAMMIGKPSADFFNIALADMQLSAGQALMIGDDIDSDIGGAQQAGIKSILVRTGKYRQAYTEASAIKPDLLLDSVANLPNILL